MLDPHVLVRSDSKSAPRARSFRERAEVRHLCVQGACTLDALVHLCLIMSGLAHDSCALISQDHVDSDASTASRTLARRRTRSLGEIKMIACAHHTRARTSSFSRLLHDLSEIGASTKRRSVSESKRPAGRGKGTTGRGKDEWRSSLTRERYMRSCRGAGSDRLSG